MFNKLTNGCTGECCREFPMSTPYAVLMDNYKAWISGNKDGLTIINDIHLIFPMVRRVRKEDGNQLYSCVHWDRKTKLCGIYDIRPQMCRDYPYGGQCYKHGCKINNDKIPEA
jgi:Fe-S-cluster containining protein